MSHEIYYTSAPEGLKRGSSGFSTVGATEGIPKALWDRLEALSAYRHHFGVAAAEGGGAGGGSGQNPVSYAHWLLSVTGTTYHVLSRVADSGVDHTQRSNAFAHHLVLEAAERAAAGPAWMLARAGVMESRWNGKVEAIVRHGGLPQGDAPGGICRGWAAVTGDAGWGGVLADLFVKSPGKPVCLIFSPGQEVLPLIGETIALLPAAARWNVTFNTYFTSMPTSATCAWRCCLAGTPAAQVGLRYAASGVVIDLTDRARLGAIVEGPYVTMARTGVAPVLAGSAGVAASGKRAVAGKPAEKAKIIPPKIPLPAVARDEEEEGEYEFAEDRGEVDREIDLSLVDDGKEGAAPPREKRESVPQIFVPVAKKKPKSNIRAVELAMRSAEGAASKAAEQRRRQIMWMFFVALGLIGVGTALVLVASRNSAPPESLPIRRDAGPVLHMQVPRAPNLMANPNATMGVAGVTTAPAPQELVTTAPVVTAPVAVPASIPLPTISEAPRFPASLTLTTMLAPPKAGGGIDVPPQQLAFAPGQFDSSSRISGVRVRFPGTAADGGTASDSEWAYKDGFEGSVVQEPLKAGSVSAGLGGAVLSWKDASGTLDVVTLGLEQNSAKKPVLNVMWKAGALVKRPEVVTVVYWLLQNSTVEARHGVRAGIGQQIAFKRPEVQVVDLTAERAPLTVQMELPKDLAVMPPKGSVLPEGWDATWFTDWGDKEAALRTADNATQVVKFHKGTSNEAADALFLLRFGPGMKTVESSFAKQQAEAQSQLEDSAKELEATNAQIDSLKKQNGTAYDVSETAKTLSKKRDDAAALVQGAKEALADYDQVKDFEINMELPGGLRVMTVRFERPDKPGINQGQ